MQKTLKYVFGTIAILLIVYFSLDIKKLDEYKAANSNTKFNAAEFAQNFWEKQLPLCFENAPDVKTVIQQLEQNPEVAFEKYAHKLGISKTHYIMLKGTGTIESIEEEFLVVAIDEKTKIQVATDFIFGNAVRDGSGMVNINEFLNMTDFNNVSVAINKMIKEKVVSRLKKSAKPGMILEFVGATEMNEENLDLNSIRIIPVSAKLTDG
jgi:predicted lipoprotein